VSVQTNYLGEIYMTDLIAGEVLKLVAQ
jgi:hypothetical protein